MMTINCWSRVRNQLLLVLAAAVLGACASAPGKPPRPARIQVEASVGFTIIEEASINGAVRADYERALGLLGQGRLEEGIKLLEAVANEAPALGAPRIDLAIAHHRQGNLDAAERHLQQALDINPRHPIALNELGIVYRKTARFADARRSYEAALAVYPGYHYARRNLAVLCELYLGDLECARDNYEAYMATVHSDADASLWLRNVRFQLGTTEAQ